MKIAGHSASTWLKFAARLGQSGIRRSKRVTKRAFGVERSLRIIPYRGFGNGRTAIASGRVLESRPIREPLLHDPWYVNLRHAYRHFTSDVVAACPVAAHFAQLERAGASDEDGYFHFRFEGLDAREIDEGWQPVEFVTQVDRDPHPARAMGQVMIPPRSSTFGVISDMDDTVIQSNVTDFLKIARLTLFQNARTRKPFEGVAAFYRALRGGADGARANPIFYVSSSTWNLYELFRVFLEHNQLPSGPILLRDMGIDEDKFIVDPGHGHKLHKIDAILAMYPRLRFILVGDSGQDDPFIYREAVRRHPGRILAIYIRDIRSQRREIVKEISQELSADGIPTLLVPTTTEAALHAAEQGWIPGETLAEIRSDQRADEALGKTMPSI